MTIQESIAPDLQDLTPSEQIGLIVVTELSMRDHQVEQARRFAVDATSELAEAERLLRAMLDMPAVQASTWARDAVIKEDVQAFMDRPRVPE